MQQKNLMRINRLDNRSQHQQGQSHRSAPPQPAPLRPAPAIKASFASTTTGTPIGQSNRSQHQQGQSQQSAPPQEQLHDQRRDQSHLRQHHKGHSQWSARPHPAPQESESTTGSITKGKPSLLVRTQALPASSDKNSGAANHERQSALK